MLIFGQETPYSAPGLVFGQKASASKVVVQEAPKELSQKQQQITTKTHVLERSDITQSFRATNSSIINRNGYQSSDIFYTQLQSIDNNSLKSENTPKSVTAIGSQKVQVSNAVNYTEVYASGDNATVKNAVARYNELKEGVDYAEFRHSLDKSGLDINFKITADSLIMPNGTKIALNEESLARAAKNGDLDIIGDFEIKVTKVAGYSYEEDGVTKTQESFTLVEVKSSYQGNKAFIVKGASSFGGDDTISLEQQESLETVKRAFSMKNESYEEYEIPETYYDFVQVLPMDYAKFYSAMQKLAPYELISVEAVDSEKEMLEGKMKESFTDNIVDEVSQSIISELNKDSTPIMINSLV